MNHRHFLANICQHPADMFPREVYADFLEEQGDVRAEFIRMSIELAEREPKLPRLLKARSMNIPASSVSIRDEQTGQYRLRTPALYEPMRFEIITEDMPSEIGSLVEVFAGGNPPTWIDAIVLDRASTAYEGRNVEYDVRLQLREIHGEPLPERQEIRELSDRCATLLTEHRREWTMAGLPEEWTWCNHHGVTGMYGFHVNDDRGNYNRHVSVDFARGFPEILTLRFQEWSKHHATLCDVMPVREVRIISPVDPKWLLATSAKWNDTGLDFDSAWRSADPIKLLTAEIPGADSERPIRYVLLPDRHLTREGQILYGDESPLPRGIDPRGVMTGNEAISVTVPTIFPTPTINIGGIP